MVARVGEFISRYLLEVIQSNTIRLSLQCIFDSSIVEKSIHCGEEEEEEHLYRYRISVLASYVHI